jgi:hypothetical protein
MGRACGMHGGEEMHILRLWCGKLRERGQLKDPGADGRIILEFTLKKKSVRRGR